MNLKIHFLLTVMALAFLIFNLTRPAQSEERVCTLNKGKMECTQRSKEYDVQFVDIFYSSN